MIRRRIISTLGLGPAEANVLIRRSVGRIGRVQYEIRAVAFVIATSERLRPLLPGRLRAKAIRAYLHCLLTGPTENLLYAGAIEGFERG